MDTLIIKNNYISASKAKHVGCNNLMNNFVGGTRCPRRIVIDGNRIKSDESSFVGIGKLSNNYCNLSVVVIFLVVVVVVAALILLGFWTQWETRPTTLLTQGLHIIGKEQADMGFAIDEMSRLTILIKYDGRWVNSMYENCKTKRVLVSDKITLEEIQKKVYNIVNVDPNEYEITMKVIYEVMKTALPTEIADDDGVRTFIFENLSSSYKIPLCITLKGKVSNQQAPSIDVGQESMPVDLNVSSQVVLEDNHDSENDLGNKEFKDSESEVENNRTQLYKLLCYMQCEEFVLNQPEIQEIKIGKQVFRRPGDPPLEEVVEKLQNEKKRVENESPAESNTHLKEEL